MALDNADGEGGDGEGDDGEGEDIQLPEKLKDDDDIQLTWWERLMNLFPCLRHGRLIH